MKNKKTCESLFNVIKLSNGNRSHFPYTIYYYISQSPFCRPSTLPHTHIHSTKCFITTNIIEYIFKCPISNHSFTIFNHHTIFLSVRFDLKLFPYQNFQQFCQSRVWHLSHWTIFSTRCRVQKLVKRRRRK